MTRNHQNPFRGSRPLDWGRDSVVLESSSGLRLVFPSSLPDRKPVIAVGPIRTGKTFLRNLLTTAHMDKDGLPKKTEGDRAAPGLAPPPAAVGGNAGSAKQPLSSSGEGV